MKRTTIVVVDDHKLFREMWVEVFSRINDIQLIGEAGSLSEAVEFIKSKRPDVVLLDINIGADSGFDAVPLIRKFSPGTKIIALSMHNKPAYAKKMLQLGARGYVTKNSSLDEICHAIKVVMNNETYISREIRDTLSEQVMKEDPNIPSIQSLSFREISVVRLLRQGYSTKEIAIALDISPRTVDVHRHNILRKLNLKNAAALIAYINSIDPSF